MGNATAFWQSQLQYVYVSYLIHSIIVTVYGEEKRRLKTD